MRLHTRRLLPHRVIRWLTRARVIGSAAVVGNLPFDLTEEQLVEVSLSFCPSYTLLSRA